MLLRDAQFREKFVRCSDWGREWRFIGVIAEGTWGIRIKDDFFLPRVWSKLEAE